MWKTESFCSAYSAKNAVFSTRRRQSGEKADRYPPDVFPVPLSCGYAAGGAFPVLQKQEKFSPFCTTLRNPSSRQGGWLWAGRSTALPGASGIPGG